MKRSLAVSLLAVSIFVFAASFTSASPQYAKIAVVAMSGGDYTDPAAAVADWKNWCPNGGPTSHCLLKIMPGVYDIGSNHIYLGTYIDLEGSGETSTVIMGNGGNPGYIPSVIEGSADTEVRSLTVQQYGAIGGAGILRIHKIRNVTINMMPQGTGGPGYDIYGIYAGPNALTRNLEVIDTKIVIDTTGKTFSPYGIFQTAIPSTLTNVSITVMANPGSGYARGIYVEQGGNATVTNSSVVVTGAYYGYGLETFTGATASITNSIISGSSFGTSNTGGTSVYIDHSTIYGGSRYVHQYPDSGNTYVGYSKVYGGTAVPYGGAKQPICVGAYNNQYQEYTDSHCGL